MTDNHQTGKEEIILEAARRRFAYYGYEKVTMDEIANDVGLGKASVYYYYPTKEALFKTVVKKEQSLFMAKAAEFLGNEISAAEKIRMYVEHRLEYFRVFHTMARLSIESFSQIKPAFGDLFRTFAGWEAQTLSSIMESGKRAREFDLQDPPRVALVLLHVLQGLQLRTLKRAAGGHIDNEQFTELHDETRTLTELLLRGIAEPAPAHRKTERLHA